MKPLTEALICIAIGAFLALAVYAAMIIDEPRRNYDPMAEWNAFERGRR